MSLHLNIDYDEGDTDSYRGVVLSKSGGTEVKRFMSGNPQADWAAWLSWGAEEKAMVLEGSSITHFLWDVPGWRMIEKAGQEILVPEDRPGFEDHTGPLDGID